MTSPLPGNLGPVFCGDQALAGEASCMVCGCTENDPCPGGCYWTDQGGMAGDVCSACQPPLFEGTGEPRSEI
jgi:hypothetical protein